MKHMLFLFLLSCIFQSCGDDKLNDYREEWIGNYNCTKSNKSFEDDTFSTVIEVVVELSSDSLLFINGNEVPVSQDGTFGPERYEGHYYDIKFTKDSIYMFTYPIVPGLGITCYIKGANS